MATGAPIADFAGVVAVPKWGPPVTALPEVGQLLRRSAKTRRSGCKCRSGASRPADDQHPPWWNGA